MFSSLASLLPSALHINLNSDLPKQTVNPEETINEDKENAIGVRTVQPQSLSDQDQPKGKDKESKSPSETFIFVRPPPSKTNHPLNLQVQLVPPNTKPPGGLSSGDATTPTSANSGNSSFTADGAPLARTSSSRSSVSYTSTFYGSSTTSFASFSSTSTTSGYRRTIIPLYNLQAHNVMTNVIVDAGTDAKIAKFQKRGIELIDLALLEPVEVWGEGGREKDARRESMRIVADEMGASVVVNTGGRRGGGGILSPKPPTTFLQPGGSRPATPSAASSATSLHSQIVLANANNSIQAPTPQYISSSTVGTPSAAPSSTFHSNSNSSSSNNATPMPPASPASLTSMSLAVMSPPSSPGPTSGKRKLFTKLFNKKQSSSNLLSPSESGFPGSPGQHYPQQQHPLARSQSPPMITSTLQDSEISPPPMFTSFRLSPEPANIGDHTTAAGVTGGAGTERLFGSRSNSMKRRSAPPPALVNPPLSPFLSNFGFASPAVSIGGGISDLKPPIEQQTTPTQISVAAGGKAKAILRVTSPTPTMVEAPKEREKEKGHGRNMSLASITSPLKATLKSRLSAVVGGDTSQSNSQTHGSSLKVDNSPTNKKWHDRDESPNPSLASKDKNRSRLSLVGTLSTNDGSVESHGGNGRRGSTENGRWSFSSGGYAGGNGQTPQQASMTQAHAQPEVLMNLRQQQLQLRPPVLDIQPTFVSSNPSWTSSNPNASNLFSLDTHPTTMTMENPDQVLQGQRALMYVWLVRRWMKKRPSGHGLSGLGDSAVGFLGGVVGGLKGEKDKEKGREKEKPKDKSRRTSHDGLGAVTAPLMYGGVEVRFEWKRAKGGKEKSGPGKKKDRNGRGRTGTLGGGGAESDGEVETRIRNRTEKERERERDEQGERGPIRGSIDGGGGPMIIAKTKARLKSEEKRKHRMSTGSLSSVTANSDTDGGGLKIKKRSSTICNNQYDDGGESDPEDSETPWICTLKLRRSADSKAGGGLLAGNAQTILQTQVLRIKVGTLSPTPHHPKVVAMLKVPFPLPDVEVERMGVVKRPGVGIGGVVPSPNPNANQDTPPYNGLMLTAEEIKDVVCSTGLWLVVREGFGGVGRVSRKGDGWRIRA